MTDTPNTTDTTVGETVAPTTTPVVEPAPVQGTIVNVPTPKYNQNTGATQ